MDLAYAAADATLGRSGANTVTEAAAVGLPAVFVPLPIGNGEQALNAEAVVKAGGALIVDDADLTPDWVKRHLPDLLTDPVRLAAMSHAASGLIRRDADDELARLVREVARR
jgi:UDP-N-acetylglucosamine--N-acetylmuramyl-(pentapeptide) pyrophosphoryl-undecaprenol N-acetylglucosamine transferase